MLTLIIVVCFLSLAFSAFCSLAESALYAVPLGHVRHLSDQGIRSGEILLSFKEDMGNPISAILILNTISNTMGASMAGALVGKMYGESSLAWFSLGFTLLILYLAEIIPKQFGVLHSKKVTGVLAYPLLFLIRFFYPLILLTRFVDKLLKRGDSQPTVTPNEMLSMAKIGTEEGVLPALVGQVIRNSVYLKEKHIKDVLTPRVVVHRMDEDTLLEEIREQIFDWNYTRIPVFNSENPDSMTGFVMQRDLMRALIKGEDHRTFKSFIREIQIIPEITQVEQVLKKFFEERVHIYAVVDEHGSFAGIVTLEDLLEELIGTEIVDEYDMVSDLRAYAKLLNREKIPTNL